VAIVAVRAFWNLQLADSIDPSSERIPLSPPLLPHDFPDRPLPGIPVGEKVRLVGEENGDDDLGQADGR
jgi:hypothetical protein